LLLERRGRTLICARGHAYDVARSGYVNLLQPQDRKSLEAGDRREAIAARHRLLASGIGASIVGGVVERAVALLQPADVVVDLGSGSGDVLGRLAGRLAVTTVGIDLSSAAAAHSAQQFPGLTWVVANADRHLPVLDRTVDLVLSIHGRRNAAECARVMTRKGQLLIAVPAADDLIELRAAILGEGVPRDRTAAVVAEHDPHFVVRERFTLREQHHLHHEAIRDLLRGTYRGERQAASRKVDAVEDLDVTLASDVMVFSRRSN
jgi:23S rRNA (guanine745-N1)-methyltransferase